MNWPQLLIAWAVLSVPCSVLVGRSFARRPCVIAPSLDDRLAPHVASQLDERLGWVGFSRDRWPA